MTHPQPLPRSTPEAQGIDSGAISALVDALEQRGLGPHSLMILRHETKGESRALRTFPHADSKPADLLFRELGRRMRSRVFEKSFRMASTLLQMI